MNADNNLTLKVYISVDMEGITGIVNRDQVTRGDTDYERARRLMTEETNAAVEGALDAGADYVLVNDSHGSMLNILIENLHPDAHLITGYPKEYAMMEGIDNTFHAALFIGYHARPGTTGGILDHTYSSATVFSIRINGIEMPELGLNAWLAGYYKVPVVFLSGDKAACIQTEEILGPKVTAVSVMEGVARSAARVLPLGKSHQLIRDGVKEAIKSRKRIKPYVLKQPYEVEITFLRSDYADNPSLIPGVHRIDGRTVRFKSKNVSEGFKLMRALIVLAGA